MALTTQSNLLTISDVNRLCYKDFLAKFGNVVENGKICAAVVWRYRPFTNVYNIQKRIEEFLDELPLSAKDGLLRLISDLSERPAQSRGLSAESRKEQSAAGLQHMTQSEQQLMSTLTTKYKNKFGFPFVICARENKKDAILKGLELRLKNSYEIEVMAGVNEVKNICNLRLRDIVDATSSSKL